MKRDDILVVMALELESDGVFDREGVPVLYTGVGKVNAAHSLTRRLVELKTRGQPLPLVVNFGSAGSRRHPTGALVACDRFLQRDMDARELGVEAFATPFDTAAFPKILTVPPVFTELTSSMCGSADRFETSHDHDAADVVEMEAYALAKVCLAEGARFACAKFITDGADSGAAADWKKNVHIAAEKFLELYRKLP